MKVANWSCFINSKFTTSEFELRARERCIRVGSRIHRKYEHTRTHHKHGIDAKKSGCNNKIYPLTSGFSAAIPALISEIFVKVL